jgi:ubiquinone/menaquinone biosynthesis C-methylase UbiE
VPRGPEVRYEPTPPEVVREMVALAGVGAGDVVYDLGCGDGRIVIAAAQRGARGVCVDIDAQRIAESRKNAADAGVTGRIAFRQEDLMETPLADATVVMLFLSQDFNLRLRPRLQRELRPGARVVSHWHNMGDWKPARSLGVRTAFAEHAVYLWVIP